MNNSRHPDRSRFVSVRHAVEPSNGQAGGNGKATRTSVVIPTMNRPTELLDCVRTLLAQSHPVDELIVVDNAELDDAAVRRLAVEAGLRYVFLRIARPGITRSRNLGIGEATGQFVLFLDDDTLLHRDYVGHLHQVFATDTKREIGGVSGPCHGPRWNRSRRLWERLSTVFRLRGTRHDEHRLLPNGFMTPVEHMTEITDVDHLRGGVAMWRREVFERERFDEFFDGYGHGEDKEFSHRVSKTWRLVLNPAAIIYHLSSPSGRRDFVEVGFQGPVNNYYIFKKLMPQTPKARLMFAWACVGMAVLNTLWMLVSPRRDRFQEIVGILKGIVHILRRRPFRRFREPGPVRVMFVVTDLSVGGLERMVDVLIRAMDRRRFEPMLCCLKQADSLGEGLAAAGVPVFEKLSRHKYDLRVLPKLVKLFRNQRVDVVCTVGSGGDRMFWGRLAARIAGVRGIVASLHSMGAYGAIERLNRWLAGWTDAFVAVAQRHRDYLVREEGCPRRRTHVIYNGIDTRLWSRAGSNPATARRIGLPPGVPVAGVVACFRPEKNQELFLRAAARVLERVPSAHFLFVGDGPRRAAVETLAETLGVVSRVHFLGERQDVPELMALMDVVVLPSDHEAFPLVVLEAQAAGKPVVATHVGALAELVADGENGYLVQRGDERALADRLASLLTDRAVARRLGRTARQRVAERFDLRQMVDGYERLFEHLADRPTRLV